MTDARPLAPGRVSIAPMIDKTDRHFRHFIRMFSKRSLLYTEMVAAAAIVHGPRKRLLDFYADQHPIVLQIGGDDPKVCAEAVRIASDWGYDEFNLNVGCPSDKVQQARFGACLMAVPDQVAQIVAAMRAATDKPVTVKHRIGIEGHGISRTEYDHMLNFVDAVSAAGSERFVVHARIAILEGLDPKQNRSIPPLRYDEVYRLKRERPHLHIEINGGFKTAESCFQQVLEGMDGVMIGRASYEQPIILGQLDALDQAMEAAFYAGLASSIDSMSVRAPAAPQAFSPAAFSKQDSPAFPSLPQLSFQRRVEAVLEYASYIDSWVMEQARALEGQRCNPRALVWPLLELFGGIKGSRRYRQVLSAAFPRGAKVFDLARHALSQLQPATEPVHGSQPTVLA